MNVKEVAQLTGLSHQAIYKKIKANKLDLEALKDKSTGHFTSEGEIKIRDLFGLSADNQPVATKIETEVAELKTEVEKLRNQVAEVTSERDILKNQVDALEARLSDLTGERDYLRQALAASISKIPNAPALPAGDEQGTRRRGLRWLFGKKRGEDNGNQ